MPTDPADFKRLILLIERDLMADAKLRALLTAADTTAAGRPKQLRAVKARIKRRRARKPRTLEGIGRFGRSGHVNLKLRIPGRAQRPRASPCCGIPKLLSAASPQRGWEPIVAI